MEVTLALVAGAIAWGLKEVGQGLLSEAAPDLIVEPARWALTNPFISTNPNGG
jgi:hypothetical protein